MKPGLELLYSIVEEDKEKALWLADQLQELGMMAMSAEGKNMNPRMWMAMMASALGYAIGNGTRILPGSTPRDVEDAVLIAESIMEDSAEDAYAGG